MNSYIGGALMGAGILTAVVLFRVLFRTGFCG